MRGTSTFICFWMRATAAAHCAAVAVHAPLMVLPSALTALLMMRLMPGKFRFTTSKSEKKNSLSFLIGPPSVPPAWCRHSGGLTPAGV